MQDFEIKKTKDRGQGLFAKRDYDKGAVVLHFGASIITRQEIVDNKIPAEISNRYLQIGQDTYLVIKDHSQFVNHHCVPNCYIKIMVNNAFLIAAIPIKKNDEITFDYSLTCSDDRQMECVCSAYSCRKTIGNFQSLPDDVKNLAIRRGTVPKFNLPKE